MQVWSIPPSTNFTFVAKKKSTTALHILSYCKPIITQEWCARTINRFKFTTTSPSRSYPWRTFLAIRISNSTRQSSAKSNNNILRSIGMWMEFYPTAKGVVWGNADVSWFRRTNTAFKTGLESTIISFIGTFVGWSCWVWISEEANYDEDCRWKNGHASMSVLHPIQCVN